MKHQNQQKIMANKNVKQQGQPVEETLNKQEAFFMNYRKAILIAVAALIILFAGVILYKNYVSGPREAKASTVLAKGQEYFDAASDYSSTDAGNLANLYAGLCYANLGKWAEAVKYLEGFSGSNDQMISPAAQGALGNAYAHTNQLDKAVSALKKAADMADSKSSLKANNSLSPTFLIQAAEILESQNKKAEALKIYQDIKKKYVNSAVSQEIDKYIERVSE